MPTSERIDSLTLFCAQWRKYLESAAQHRDELLDWQSKGLFSLGSNGSDLLPTMIDEADQAVQQYRNILVKMESLRDRAICGEDV